MRNFVFGLLLSGLASTSAQDVLYTPEEIRNRFAMIREGQMYDTLQTVNERLARADGLSATVELFDRIDPPLPVVSTGGHIFVPVQMMLVIGNRPHEVAAMLAPLRLLARKKHTEGQQLIALGQQVLGSIIKDQTARDIAITITSLGSTAASRQDFSRAYPAGLEYMTKAGFDPTAMYSLQARIEALSRRDTSNPIKEYLLIYPPIASTLETILARTIQAEFGRDIRKVLLPTARAASGDTLAEFANDDPAMPLAFRAATGFSLRSVGYWQRGQCTWLAARSRIDEIPRGPAGTNDAHTWLNRCRQNGYGILTEPKNGALVVWSQSVGGGSGHVGIVTKVNTDGSFEVWDSNYGPEAKDNDPQNGKVRHRVVRNRRDITGYIGWPNGQTEAPVGSLGYVAAGRSEVVVAHDEFHLGDDQPDSKTVRTFAFELTPNDLTAVRQATLEVWVKAAPQKDPIFTVNFTEVGRVIAQTDGWVRYQFSCSPTALHHGQNALVVRSYTPNFQSGYDNCDIRGISLKLER